MPLTVIHCCMGGNQANAEFLRPIVARLGMEFVAISEWPEHEVTWERKTWLQELSRADIVVVCQRAALQPAKSATRVTQAQYLGLPVCATPIPANREAIEDGVTGFLCDTEAQWEQCLQLLRDDQQLRLRMGNAARAAAQRCYSIDAVGGYWLHVLGQLAREAGAPPKVDIIIPTWNNFRYLQECVKSVRLNTPWPYNLIVINSGGGETADWLSKQPDIIHHNAPDRLHFSAAVNRGLSIGKEKYVCLLNDDTIVANNWLTALMHEAMKPGIGAVNPWSNCDEGWLHNDVCVVDGVRLQPGMSFESVAHIIPKLYTQQRPRAVKDRPWVPFYCTVLPRAAIDRAGPLDEQFSSGCEDLDYCRRLEQLGYKFCTTDAAFVFHFGGATRKNAERIDTETHHEEDRANQAYLKQKHQVPGRKSLTLFTGQGWEKWTPNNVEQGGIGGSETCAVHVAHEFARRGYEVVVYGDPPPGQEWFDEVRYLPYGSFDPAQPVDIFISSRHAGIFQLPINARRKVCWVHDIFLDPTRGSNVYSDHVDFFFVLSPWHRDFFCDHHGVHPDRVFVTRDAIDLQRFQRQLPRVPGRMLYSSSPDRGLDVLLDCMGRIRAAVPAAHLRVLYGFNNWERAVLLRGDKQEIAWMQRIQQQLQQPGVEYVGRVGQKQVADEFLQAELWGYPTYFPETFCITAAEAMAAGTPVVTSNLAALATTVGADGGVLLDGDPRSEAYQKTFVELCVYVLTDKAVWRDLSERGRRKASGYRWDTLVDDWIKVLV